MYTAFDQRTKNSSDLSRRAGDPGQGELLRCFPHLAGETPTLVSHEDNSERNQTKFYTMIVHLLVYIFLLMRFRPQKYQVLPLEEVT